MSSPRLAMTRRRRGSPAHPPGQSPADPTEAPTPAAARWRAQQPFCHGGAALVGGADQQDVDERIVRGARPDRPTVDPTGQSRAGCLAPWSVHMPLDPRTPVLVGVGQWSNRVDRGEPAARARRPDGRGPPPGRRPTAAPPATCCAGPTPSARSCDLLAALPQRRRPGGRAPRRPPARPGRQPHRRQRAPGAGQPGLPRHRRRRRSTSCWSAGRRRGAPGQQPAPADEPGWTMQSDDVGARRAPDRPRGRAQPPGRDGPQASPCRPQVYPLFEQALRHAAGPVVDEHLTPSASCGPASRRWRPTTRTPGSSDGMTAEEIRTPSARQPLGRAGRTPR